ncbi:MAG: alpha/beta fold hydrolase [Acidimicrobiia bacterium]|nr:alpha/beta fold hydrolase [Acidimicrobiia bacterium]
MTIVDRPVFVPFGDEALFAIASEPDTAGPHGVVLLPAGGHTFTPQGNRWAFDFAHRLAAAGFPTVRFDWQGIGDSTGVVETFTLHQPATTEAEAALSILDTESRVLVGQCYGARTAMAMADRTEGIGGVALLAPPVRDFARGDGTATRQAYELSTRDFVTQGLRRLSPSTLIDRAQLERIGRVGRTLVRAKWRQLTARFRAPDPTPWVSEAFLSQLEGLVRSGVPTLLLYGEEENDYKEFDEARAGKLGELLERGSSTVTIEVVPGSAHAAETVEMQQLVVSKVEEWLVGLEAPGAA